MIKAAPWACFVAVVASSLSETLKGLLVLGLGLIAPFDRDFPRPNSDPKLLAESEFFLVAFNGNTMGFFSEFAFCIFYYFLWIDH